MVKCIDQATGEDWTLFQGDCVEITKQLPDNCIDYSVYSPPFANLYIYSDSERDMGNCADDGEFLEHYEFMVRELYRMLRPGRLVSVHCKDLVDYAGSAGRAGLRDFPGDIIRIHERCGFKYHARVTIWKDPVIEMQRTKAHGLLYKTLRADGSFSRQGLAEYVLTFRKWPTEAEEPLVRPVVRTKEEFPLSQWQEWASPVWTTVDQTNVLNVQQARDNQDEKHLCPLQLDVIERCVRLWSNPRDVVFTPFAGIGSELFVSLKHERRAMGCELKESYFKHAVRNLEEASKGTLSLFSSAVLNACEGAAE